MKEGILLIQCKDQKGILARVTDFIYQQSGNIVYIDQYVDRENDRFFMRLECEFKNAFLKEDFKAIFEASIGQKFEMTYELYPKSYRQKVALFISKYDHCLYDILSRVQSKELAVEVPFILSNHRDLEPIAKRFEIPFFYVPTKDRQKSIVAKEQIAILNEHEIDTVVLARYMQIVHPLVIENYRNKIINIHHSFLPAFPGAKPYHSAFERGVKLIGATSHYVTEDLDQGPIIEQDVTHVSHLHSIKDLIAKGRDLERIVLSKALKLHIDHKLMVFKNKTIVFS